VNTEYKNLERWVHATSHYLADVLPQLDMFSVEYTEEQEKKVFRYTEEQEKKVFRLSFVEEDSSFIRAVVVPKIAELLSEFSGGCGETFVNAGVYTFVWHVRQSSIRKYMRRLFGRDTRRLLGGYAGCKFCPTGDTVLMDKELIQKLLGPQIYPGQRDNLLSWATRWP